MNDRSALEHLAQILPLTFGAFCTVVAVQALAIAVPYAMGSSDLEVGLWVGVGVFMLFLVGGVLFGVVPLLVGFTPLYAWLSAKGYANWATGVLAGVAIAGLVCLHPKWRLLWSFWLIDGAAVGLITHWAWCRVQKIQSAATSRTLSRP
ncbi:hypothetical protein MO767_18215 [Pseudomonas sp. UYIF39]|uniref:hypothetical protein n=1 Tax=Pseudomonas sp. UYIF39 TaxID=1630747 RepID=UPI00249EB513|nr:hypothetical protein [Pseudomonas sp. UYIF39]MDI3356270.1 hypothetical protein [Pseudomonas sp. UYIF39]